MINPKDNSDSVKESEKIFRVDKFLVPDHAQDEFLQAVKKTHIFLRTCPGFIHDYIFKQFSGDGNYNFVTVVEWQNLQFVSKAKEAVQQMQNQEKFNLQEIIKRNEIKSDFSFCKSFVF